MKYYCSGFLLLTFCLTFLLFDGAKGQNPIDNYVNNKSENSYKILADNFDRITSPMDLAFRTVPFRKRGQLWVINNGTKRSGGSTVILKNAHKKDEPDAEYRQDGNAWHFMALATAIAFGDNGNFATATGIENANRQGIHFTGPALWTSDLSVYAKRGNPPTSDTNGSHLDMVHQSPECRGIAHEKENIYWVFDGFYGNICRYDFNDGHYPGGEDHSDAKVYRYPEIKVQKDGMTPSHMEIHESSGWLYINDIGNSRVLRMKINSGNKKNRATPDHREPIDLWVMENANWEVFIDSGKIKKPSGMTIDENRLIITDNATNKILFYDISQGNPNKLGELAPGNFKIDDIMGIEKGPKGQLYFVDHQLKQVVKIENKKAETTLGIQKAKSSNKLKVFPNPTDNGIVNLEYDRSGFSENAQLTVLNSLGKKVKTPVKLKHSPKTLDLSGLQSGMYFLNIKNQGNTIRKKVMVR